MRKTTKSPGEKIRIVLGGLHSAIGYLTPQEAKEACYENLNADEKAA